MSDPRAYVRVTWNSSSGSTATVTTEPRFDAWLSDVAKLRDRACFETGRRPDRLILGYALVCEIAHDREYLDTVRCAGLLATSACADVLGELLDLLVVEDHRRPYVCEVR